MPQKATLSANQRKALQAMLTNAGVTKAAAACKLSRWTLYRYLRDPVFKAELNRRQDAVLAAATSALAEKAGDAVEALGLVLADGEASASAKTSAALGILRTVYDLVGVREVLERLTALEERMRDEAAK
uniref:Uncharacterized protein n=1 Tax=viral metagenome TaxID=1070528 RepID=A0A6M3M9N5_9ZZZZ